MAIPGSDGSITLTTKIDDAGLKQGTKNLRSEAMKLAAEYRKAGMTQSEAQKKAYRELGITAKETDKVKQKTKEFGSESEKSGEKARKAYSDIRSGISKITKTLGVLGTAGSAAFAALVKSAASSFAEYEQLVGGVETLFKDSANMVKDYAAKAYETAGMSANDYMSTVTSFSASLLQSLGQDTEKAAQYADMAIIDMADNANKMGTDMQRIQDAYQGFAKQNYTMLDNLKLGYGGTKTEMERLIAEANKVKKANGEMANLSIDRFSDVVEAIHIVQTEMGITGTTAKEASDTIQGSVASMKASWNNLLTGIADENADLEKLMSQFGDSVVTVFKNLAPVVKQAVSTLPKVITKLGSEFAKAAPDLLGSLIPELIQGGFTIVETLVQTISANAHRMGEAAAELAIIFVQGIINITPQLFEVGAEFISGFVEGLASQYPALTTAITTITGIFAGIKLTPIITSALSGMKPVLSALGTGFKLLSGQIDIATAKQLLFNAAQKANVIGIVITAIAALAGAVYGAVKAYDAWLEKNSELVQETKAMKEASEEASEATQEFVDSLESVVEAGKDAVVNAEAEAHANQTLANELYDLAAKEELTAENKERMKTIVDQLNESISDLNLEFDEETGQLNLTKDAVDKLIQSKMELARVEAVNDLYTEYLKKQYEYQMQVTDAAEKRAEAEAELNDIIAQGKDVTITRQGQEVTYKQYTAEQSAAMENLRTTIANYTDDLEYSSGRMAAAQEEIRALSEVAGVEAPAAFDSGAQAIEQQRVAVEGLTTTTQASILGMQSALEAFKSGDIGLNEFREAIDKQLSLLPESAKAYVVQIKNSFNDLAKGNITAKEFKAVWEKAFGDLPLIALSSSEEMAAAFGHLSPAAQIAVSEIITSFMGLSNGTIGMEQFVETLKASMANLPPSAQTAVQSIITAFARLNAGEIDAEAFSQTVATAMASLTTEAGTIGASIPTEIASGIDGGKSSVESSAGGVKDAAVAKLEATSEAYSKGQDFGTGYGDGIGSMGSYIYNKAYAIAQQALQAVQDSQASSSPSKKAAKLGRDFSDGYALGIDDGEKDVNKVAGNLALSALESVRAAQDSHSPAEGSAELGEDFADGFAVGIERETDAVAAVAESMVNAATDPIEKALKSLNIVFDPTTALANNSEIDTEAFWDRIWQDLSIDPMLYHSINAYLPNQHYKIQTYIKDGEVIAKTGQAIRDGEVVYHTDLLAVQNETLSKSQEAARKLEGVYLEQAKQAENAYKLSTISYQEYLATLDDLFEQQRDRKFRDLEHSLAMDYITEAEYYDSLQLLRDTFFEEGSEEWMDYTEKIYAYRKKQREDEYQETQEMFQQELDNLDTMMRLGLISEEQYYQELANYRDKYFKRGTQEWDDYTLKIYENRLMKHKDMLAELETAEKSMFDKLSSYGSLMTEKPKNQLDSIHPLFELKRNKKGEEFYRINPIRNQKKELQKYYDTLSALRAREGMDSGLFDIVKNMSFEESLEYAKLLMRMGDEQFAQYIADWKEKQALSKQISDDIFGKDGELTSNKVLADLDSQTKNIEKYGEALMAVNNRGALPKDFFEMMRDMGVEEGLEYANALLDLSDEDFKAYIEAWERKVSSSQDVAKQLYADEAETLYNETKNTFEEFISEFLGFGENAGKKFNWGFTQTIKKMLEKLSLLNISTTATSAFFKNFDDRIDWTGVFNSPYVSGSALPSNRSFITSLDDYTRVGPEVPQNISSQWSSNSTSQPQQITVIMEVEGREFGQAVLDYGGQASRRVGVTIGGIQ